MSLDYKILLVAFMIFAFGQMACMLTDCHFKWTERNLAWFGCVLCGWMVYTVAVVVMR